MVLCSLFLFGLLLLSGCEKPLEPPPPPRPALVIEVGKTASSSATVLVGEVKSRFESNQGFRIAGKIIERKVDVGAIVKKGQVLARLDASDTNLGVSSALADVRVAEANRALAKSEVQRQRQLVNKKFISQSALDKFEAELKQNHPENNFVKDKIRQQLQVLRDMNIIEFVSRGKYRKITQ